MAGAFGIDPSVLDKLRTFDDYNRAEEEFQYKKQLAQQNALQNQLQNQALIQQAQNGGFSPKDILGIQLQQQNKADEMSYKRDALAQQAMLQNATREQNLLTRQAQMDTKNQQLQDKKDMERNKALGALDSTTAEYNRQIDEANKLLSNPSLNSIVGMADARLPAFSEGQQNAINQYDTVVAQSMIGGLQNLKSQSATGASGFGALSDSEGKLIRDAQGALQRSSSEAEFKKNLENYINVLSQSRDRVQNSFNRVYSGGQPSQADVQAELRKRGLIK